MPSCFVEKKGWNRCLDPIGKDGGHVGVEMPFHLNA